MKNLENLEQISKINFDGSEFVRSLRVRELVNELGPDARQFNFDISEVVSNLDRMFAQIFDSRHDIEIALDDALSGEKQSLTPIKLPPEMKEKFRNLLLTKINEQIDEI